jgi:3-hydroxyisobutyrate dehydrogenase-like beta-hydroxyacid dehydrogenase
MRKEAKLVGVIGLGLMGSALAERFLKNGFAVAGFDIDQSARRALKKLGGRPVEGAAAVARLSRRIIFSLPTTAVVKEVIREMGTQLRPGSIIIDTTTGEPEQTAALGAKLAKGRIRYLDATIVGSSAQTREGDVIVLVGGPRATLEKSRDLIHSFARQTFHAGPCGSGARMKLVVNLVLGLNRAVLAEGLSFAEAVGILPQRALEILKSGVAYSRVMDTKGEKMLRKDFSPQAMLSQHLKDVRLILSLGKRKKAKLPMTALHRKLLAQVVAAGHGDLDNSAIIKAFE